MATKVSERDLRNCFRLELTKFESHGGIVKIKGNQITLSSGNLCKYTAELLKRFLESIDQQGTFVIKVQ